MPAGIQAWVARQQALGFAVVESVGRLVRHTARLAPPTVNIVPLFAHDLIKFLTNFLLLREENAAFWRCQATCSLDTTVYPFFRYEDVGPDSVVDHGRYPSPSVRNSSVGNVMSGIARAAALLRGGPLIALTEFGRERRSLFWALLRAGYRISFPTTARVHVPGWATQWPAIEDAISDTGKQLGFPRAAPDLATIFRRYVTTYLSDEPVLTPWDVLVCGSPLATRNRVMAASTMQNGGTVVAMGHSEGAAFACEEPFWKYGELTYCHHYVGYGPEGPPVDAPAFSADGPVTYVPSNSPAAIRLYREAPIPAVADLRDPRVMYIPTAFLANIRYGPCRDLPDELYARWQDELLRRFSGVIYKTHPEQAVARKPPAGVRVVYGSLESAVDAADVFVFDYMSTAFAVAAATDKPIIYFDLGIRRLSAVALEHIKQRCVYVNVNLERIGEAFAEVDRQRDKRCTNEFTSRYSLRGDREARSETCLRLVEKVAARAR